MARCKSVLKDGLIRSAAIGKFTTSVLESRAIIRRWTKKIMSGHDKFIGNLHPKFQRLLRLFPKMSAGSQKTLFERFDLAIRCSKSAEVREWFGKLKELFEKRQPV